MKYKIIPVTAFNQNCSLVWCEEKHEAVLIDPGGDVDFLCGIIDSSSLVVRKILLTHGHVDHVGGAMELSRRYRIPIIGPHINDQWLLKNVETQCYILDFDVISPVQPDYWLIDSEVVEIGNFKLHVLHCPGHSPGHVVFWNRESKFIFMGDVLFKGSIGRTDLPGGNTKDLILSIKKLFSFRENISFLPGHGPSSTFNDERFHNDYIRDFI